MLNISIGWIVATTSICIGYILVLSKSFVPKIIPNLYLFGKARGLHTDVLKTHFLQVPKSWFSHFYFAGIVCNSVVLVMALKTYLYSGVWSSTFTQAFTFFGNNNSLDISPLSVVLALIMIQAQVVRRFLECVFVSSYSKSTMSLVIYSAGVAFYSLLGISVLCQAPETKIELDNLPIQWFDTVAIAIFIWASYKQHKTSKILAKLRQSKDGNVENHKHHIPHGDLFHYVSSPHYLTEIIIYTSINLLFLAKHEVLVCIWTFVTSNQVISAILAHRWYKENFKGYPKERRALIPYIF